ncbi:hypothetical protein CBL_02572 [Carabus blaptoides fortunei]
MVRDDRHRNDGGTGLVDMMQPTRFLNLEHIFVAIQHVCTYQLDECQQFIYKTNLADSSAKLRMHRHMRYRFPSNEPLYKRQAPCVYLDKEMIERVVSRCDRVNSTLIIVNIHLHSSIKRHQPIYFGTNCARQSAARVKTELRSKHNSQIGNCSNPSKPRL